MIFSQCGAGVVRQRVPRQRTKALAVRPNAERQSAPRVAMIDGRLVSDASHINPVGDNLVDLRTGQRLATASLCCRGVDNAAGAECFGSGNGCVLGQAAAFLIACHQLIPCQQHKLAVAAHLSNHFRVLLSYYSLNSDLFAFQAVSLG